MVVGREEASERAESRLDLMMGRVMCGSMIVRIDEDKGTKVD